MTQMKHEHLSDAEQTLLGEKLKETFEVWRAAHKEHGKGSDESENAFQKFRDTALKFWSLPDRLYTCLCHVNEKGCSFESFATLEELVHHQVLNYHNRLYVYHPAHFDYDAKLKDMYERINFEDEDEDDESAWHYYREVCLPKEERTYRLWSKEGSLDLISSWTEL